MDTALQRLFEAWFKLGLFDDAEEGQTEKVTFVIDDKAFLQWDEEQGGSSVYKGEAEIRIGPSSNNIALTKFRAC